MGAADRARRTVVHLTYEGIDVTAELESSLISATYTDNTDDKADDLQLTLQDESGVWLHERLAAPRVTETTVIETTVTSATKAPAAKKSAGSEYKIGAEVIATGRPKYTSYGGKPGWQLNGYRGKVTHLNLKAGVPYPIHVDYKGWFSQTEAPLAGGVAEQPAESVSTENIERQEVTTSKGPIISVQIVQKNWRSDGKDKVLDCGEFEIDTIDFGGPPDKVTIKAAAVPASSRVRTERKTQTWEAINLRAVAAEKAAAAGMRMMYESGFNPTYDRLEQLQESDVELLQRLARDAGISLKVTAKTIVLYDEAQYEAKDGIFTIRKGATGVISYKFKDTANDTSYCAARVRYTDPTTGKMLHYTFVPPGADKTAKVLEINERVSSREEARVLAMKRLRQKNKVETTGDITLTGNVELVTGCTVLVEGFGIFDGKYIIDKATHKLTGGYTTAITINSVLEGY